MYNLFKLVRLLSVKNDVNPVTIDTFTWSQNGESSLLAVSCSNGFIVLRYSCTGCQPVVKQLPWPPDHPVTSLCFDPTVTWLLVLTDNGNIFIIPALPMLDPGSQVNQLWTVDDVTIITCLKPRGVPTVTTWWYTLDGQHVAIVATKLGELLFVELLQQVLVSERCVDEHIKMLELIKDDTQTMTHLLITGQSGKQWKMLLEKRMANIAAPDTELNDLGYDHIDGLSLPIVSVLNKLGVEEEDLFSPVVLSQFARSVNVSPQYAKGRHFVSAYCTKNSTYQVFDSNLEHNPLFVYRLPVGSLHTVLTDRIMFMATKLSGDQKLIVLSNQKAEISDDSDQDFNKEAILQQFELPADEKLKCVVQKSFPFYWHEKLEEDQIKLQNDQDEQKLTGSDNSKTSALEIPLTRHTVLDGCIIVTDCTVYECRPRSSPERLFLELCINQTDSKLVEQLGISLGLDLNFLFEAAADFLLCHGKSKQATRLFHMSKGSPVTRISSFAKYGYIQDILPFLQQMLRKENSELTAEEYRKLVELGLHGLVLRLSQEPENEEITNLFRLGVNFEKSEGSITSVDELYHQCQSLQPTPTRDVIAKVVLVLFKVEPTIRFQNGEKFVAYKDLQRRSDAVEKEVFLPSYCTTIVQQPSILRFECPLTMVVNGEQLICTVTFIEPETSVSIADHHIKCEYALNIDQRSIDGILLAVHCFRFCKGVHVSFDDKLPKGFKKETVSFLPDEHSARTVGRSKSCKKLLPLLGKKETCPTCMDTYTQFKRRIEKASELTDEMSPSPAKQSPQPLSNIEVCLESDDSNPNIPEVDPSFNPTIELSQESHSDMESVLASIIEDGSANEFKSLLQSQLQECKKDQETSQRRWDSKVVSICLGVHLKSPQAYTNSKESGVHVLPSRKLLQCFKSIVKQQPGFTDQNLKWMKNESIRQNISQFGLHGGILISEMAIQDNLVITKAGDIVGIVDIGETSNSANKPSGKKKVEVATHALQFVFHGFTGFRWPVVYFGVNTTTAHKLYTTFWDCVGKVDQHDFTVDYVMTDGASSNRQFVLEFSDYEDIHKTSLRLLTEAGLQSVLLDFAMARGLVIEALEELSRQEQYRLSETSLDLLLSRGYGGHLAQVSSGAFLHLLDAKRLVKIICERPQLVAQHPDLLLDNLNDLDLSALLQLVEVLDPSKPVIRGFVQRKLHSRRRTSSLTSLTGSGEFGDGASSVRKDLKSLDATRLIHCFLMVVLHLNNRRALDGEPVNTDFLFENVTDMLKTFMESSQMARQKISGKPNPIGCGQTHAAVALKNGDLFTWGKTNNGRLGHGEQKGNVMVCAPCKVGNFQTLQIKVTSVACGMQHTIALTNQGLYGWGSSKYGQVGLGTKHVYTRPMLVEEMSKVVFIAVDCGQYHSVALSDDGQMFSWGWGVHGQLGHGDTEEGLVPKLITSFSNQSVVKVAAGYCHTLALTLQGELFAFGCGFFGQLGLGTSIKHTLPVKVTIPEKIITMGTKFFHSVAVDIHNRVYQWGSHPHGLRHFVHSQRRARQTGQSNFEQADGHLRPRIVETTFVNGRIKQVVCGSFHSCIVTKDGDVYTWGRNLDGQLGNGTRQDGRIPQMVTTINDRNILHLTCGGEYNIAMDIDSQLWVWGRNEFGQLGLQASDTRQSNKVIKTAGSKNVGQNLTEVLVPVQLNLLPGSPTSPASWYNRSLAESFSISESMESLSSLPDEDGTDMNIPNLAEIGAMPYSRIIVPVILQCVPNLCDCNQMLRDAVDMKDWCVAASINMYLHNYTQAMAYHLMALRDTCEDTGKEEFTSISLKITKHYYRLMSKTQSRSVEEDNKNFLHQVFFHWEQGKCLVPVLEDFLDSVLDDLSLLLAAIIFRKPPLTSDEKMDIEKPSLNEPTPAFLSTFTTKFCLKLSSSVLSKLQKDVWSESSAATTLQLLGGSDFNSIPMAMLEGDKLPYDQLWQDIMQNLQKGQDGRKYIYVTHSELDRLEEHLSDPEQNQGQVTQAVFFTCGHYYTKVAFMKEVEKMNKDTSVVSMKLPETLSVIREYYGRKGCLSLACPRCVVGAVMSF